MRKAILPVAVLAASFWIGFATAGVKQRAPDYEKLLREIKAKLQTIAQSQEKLDIIVQNQEKILGKLKQMRRWN